MQENSFVLRFILEYFIIVGDIRSIFDLFFAGTDLIQVDLFDTQS